MEADYGRPPVWLSFQTYHVMVGLGMLFIGSTLLAGWWCWRGVLFEKRWFLWYFVFAVGLAFAANETGLGGRGSGAATVDRLSHGRCRGTRVRAGSAPPTVCRKW